MNLVLASILNVAAFVLGQWLVTRGRWTGFLTWAASNLLVAVCCFCQDGLHPTGCLFVVYGTANLWSMITWRRGRMAGT